MTRALHITLLAGLLLLIPISLFAGGSAGRLPDILVETDWLAEELTNDRLVILDTGRSAEEYDASHIPGAVHFPVERFYSEVDGIPGMFSGETAVEDALRDAGVNANSRVVVYDPGHGLWATRLFWTLETVGHTQVAVVNGGFGKWTAEGRTVSTEAPEVERGDFVARFNPDLVITSEDIAANLDDITVIDTRSPDEYSGLDVRAARGGHIPGAVNVNWVYNNLSGESTTFLPVNELEEFYAAQLSGEDGKIVTHCQTGVRGAHTYFVLRLLGYEDVALYDASWVDWGNNDTLPVEVN